MNQPDNRDHSAAVYRLVTGLLFLILAACSAFISLAAVQIINPHQLFVGRGSGQRVLSFLDGMDWISRLGIAAGAAILGIFSLVMLLRPLLKSQGSAALHILAVDDGGFVAVDSRSISTIAAQAALSAHGVIDVEVHVRGTGSSPVRLKVEAGVYPGANVKRSGNEARELVRETVEELVGIKVRDVTIRVHIIETDSLAWRIG